MIPVPVGLDPNQDHHPEYGSPLDPAPEMAVQFRDTALATVNFRSDRFSTPQRRRLYRWRPDQGHFSLVREDDDDGDYDLYEYDTNFGRGFFKPYQPPHRPTKPRHPKIEPEPETPPHQQFFVRLPDGTYAVTREYSRDDLYVYDAKKKRYVRVA